MNPSDLSGNAASIQVAGTKYIRLSNVESPKEEENKIFRPTNMQKKRKSL